MNTLLEQQLNQLFGAGNPIPQEVNKLIPLIDNSYTTLQNEVRTVKELSGLNPSEMSLLLKQNIQNSSDQNTIISNLKRSIAALEPGSQILQEGQSTLEETEYLTDSLIKLIEAHKKSEESLRQRKVELETLNIQLQNEKNKLAAEKAKDEAVLFAIGDGLIVTNTQGLIVMVNGSFQNLLGWQRTEAIGKEMSKLIKKENKHSLSIPDDKRLHIKAVTSGQQQISSPEETYFYTRKDKTKFPVSISVAPITLNGVIVGAVEVFKDITKEKEIEKTKNEFVSVASHQLRTPLSSVNWYTEMLIDGELSGEEYEENMTYLKEIGKAVDRMTVMINALLNVSRLELGTFSVEPEIVDLTDIVQKVITDLKPRILEKNHQLKGQFNTQTPNIKTDPKLLTMVVQNLISNAVKYTPNNGIITLSVTLSSDQQHVFIIIQDNGHGIPDKDKDRIFSKMFRASNIMKMDTDGNGLGLYIVKSIMDSLGGKIWFDSKENQGTTFYITLPASGSKETKGYKALVNF